MKIEEELKSRKITDEYQKLFLNILFSASWLEDKTAHIFKSANITSHQYNVLRILRGSLGTPLPAFEIQSRMISKNSNVTRIIEKLVAKKLVHKKFNDNNRRMIEVTITQEGLDILKQLDDVIPDNYAGLFNNLSREEADLCSELLDKIRE